jgi:acyl-homoserine-lactone acylase
VPVRPAGVADWSSPVPGDTSATLWTAIHRYEDLPRVLDPPGGWVQNSNSPPWYTTYPLGLDPDAFPPEMAPRFLSWRERRGIRMLAENPRLTLDRLVELKYSTQLELADAVVDDLVAAARQSGDATAMQAAEVLASWDQQANPDSTGALLFSFWVGALPTTDPDTLSDLFAIPWDPADPLHTPAGLLDRAGAARALVTAAVVMKSRFGRLDVPFGEAARLQRGALDLPANGFPGDPCGVFRALYFGSGFDSDFDRLLSDQRVAAVAGDSYIAAVEFADPVRARVLTTYGNASQPGSPHVGDHLALAAKGELRPAWRRREEIAANLEAREVVAAGAPAATPSASVVGRPLHRGV